MKNLFISIIIFLLTLFFLTMILSAINAGSTTIGGFAFLLIIIYFFLFCGHLYEMIKERDPLYILARGIEPGSLIRRISSLASRKKQSLCIYVHVPKS